ncbi:CPCC family cysteine-rich protein [Streptomyces atratus]|uniref:CPCC family cysteine-rich protein n=1 Tax=Streptomyces atratus TaxID=1893 RepID=UPI0016710EDA|nr:CPCC family cysteine-rich protein [Streptomyces atratus]WPW31157.1 CPCC family cysteine-rich protein [Streptomyces atratus]GGT08877.1 hypothetical protein GCM10010207_04300 [Streptomyces atratus]
MAPEPEGRRDCTGEPPLPLSCCGHLVLDEIPGSYTICPVCFWEDDGVQFRWPTMTGGANKISLIEAQRNYQNFGACDEHDRRFVWPPAADEPLDPAWRPIDLARDSFEVWGTEDWAPWPADLSVLCWWLPTGSVPTPSPPSSTGSHPWAASGS